MRGNLWGPDAPSEDRPLELVVYRSRLIGFDPELVVWGGGNTSVKTVEVDFRGRRRDVLRIKGSGTDLKTIDQSGFPGVFRDDVLALLNRDDMTDEEMVAYLEHCMVESTGRRPSIETLLHAFLPARHVDHTHADSIVALTNTERGTEAVREALGDRVRVVQYRRPGFLLAKQVRAVAQDCEAIVLANHGLITWGPTGEESYRATIDLAQRADEYLESRSRVRTVHPATSSAQPVDLTTLLLKLRSRLGHVILRLEIGPGFQALADRADIEELALAGPATADHVLRIRPWACVLDGADPSAAVDGYKERYRAFYARHASPGLSMLDSRPKVFLIPGAGMITAGRDATDAKVTSDVAFHTLSVAARGKDAHGSYRSLSDEDLFHIDYWPLELYKLTLASPPCELEGRIVAITGAASGIGRAVARHLASLGAQLALLDQNGEGLDETSSLIKADGWSEPLEITVDLTDEAAVSAAIECTVRAFGGIDGLVSNAGIPAAGRVTELDPALWRRSLDVNATSHFLVTAAVMKVMQTTGFGGSIVYIASKNAFGPGAGFGAYSAAKAAEVQLARIVALEGGTGGIRSNVVNPDAVFEDSGLWTHEVRRERAAAHGVPVHQLEQFYARRNLLNTTITGRDVAEAVGFLLSDRAKATTGTVITVDGGVAAAFPR